MEFGKLTPSRGIRQGDFLSFYIFILCAEVFSTLLQEAQVCGKLQRIKVGS